MTADNLLAPGVGAETSESEEMRKALAGMRCARREYDEARRRLVEANCRLRDAEGALETAIAAEMDRKGLPRDLATDGVRDEER